MNTLKETDYLSQRNNRLKPSIACNVTSMCMGLFQAGYDPRVARDKYNKNGTNYLQPEDALMSFMQQDKYRKLAKGSLAEWKKYPEQSFNALIAGTNDFMGKEIYYIDWSESIESIMSKLMKRYGVVVCGNFPGTSGHFVNVGGFNHEGFLINDPWGGYGDKLSFDDFKKIIYYTNPGSYWVFYAEPNDETD